MALHLVPSSPGAKPVRPRRARRGAVGGTTQVRLIDCRPDLYDLLRGSWRRQPSARFLPALLLSCLVLMAVAIMLPSHW